MKKKTPKAFKTLFAKVIDTFMKEGRSKAEEIMTYKDQDPPSRRHKNKSQLTSSERTVITEHRSLHREVNVAKSSHM